MFPWSSGAPALHSFPGLPPLSSSGSAFASGSYRRPALDSAPATALPLTPASAQSRQHSENGAGVEPSPASSGSACQSPNNNFPHAVPIGAQSSWLSPAAAACGPQWPAPPASGAAAASPPFPPLPWQLPASSSAPSTWPASEPQNPLLDTKSYAQLMSSFWNAQSSPHYAAGAAAAPPQASASGATPSGAGGLFSPFLEAGSPGGAHKRAFPSSSQQLAMASFLFSNSLNNFAAAQGNSWMTPSAASGSLAHSPTNKTLCADSFQMPSLRPFSGNAASATAGSGGGSCADLKPFGGGGSLFNGLSAPFMSGFMGAGSPFGVGLPALNDALNVPLAGAGGAVGVAGGKRFASRTNGCECPNCQEADRLGPVVGAQLRKSGVHSCHIPGCGKVYNKVCICPLCARRSAPFVCRWR